MLLWEIIREIHLSLVADAMQGQGFQDKCAHKKLLHSILRIPVEDAILPPVLHNNVTEIFDSSKKKWKVVNGGPSISDYGILSFSKLGVYIFGGMNTFHLQDIHRFYEGERLNFT